MHLNHKMHNHIHYITLKKHFILNNISIIMIGQKNKVREEKKFFSLYLFRKQIQPWR